MFTFMFNRSFNIFVLTNILPLNSQIIIEISEYFNWYLCDLKKKHSDSITIVMITQNDIMVSAQLKL